MEQLNFGWGNPYFLLDVLSQQKPYIITSTNTKKCSYGPDEGMSELIKLTRDVIKQTTGQEYDYVFITHGATGAINSFLRYMKVINGYETVRTTKFGYPFYDGMIYKAGLKRRHSLAMPRPTERSFALIDSPSNPEGLQTINGSWTTDAWDAVYHSKIYTDDLKTIPCHMIMVGSYSKLLGLTGARIGWIATNDVGFYKVLAQETLWETATISLFSQQAVIETLKTIDLDKLLDTGRQYLQDNRSEMQKIEYIFDYQEVQKNGMFYLAEADKKAIEILQEAKIDFIQLDDTHVRLSMGQTRENVNTLIKRIRKVDRI